MKQRILFALILSSCFTVLAHAQEWAVQRMTSDPFEKLYDVFFVDDLTGWAVGSNGRILKTVDAGQNWNAQNSGVSQDLQSVHFVDADNGWAVGLTNGTGGDAVVIHTTNGGDSWSPQLTLTETRLTSVYFTDENTGYISGALSSAPFSDIVLKTTNGGNNWNEIYTDDQPFFFDNIFFLDENTGWLSAGPIILKTQNGGMNWDEQTTLPQGPGEGIFFIDENLGWAVGGRWADQCSHVSSLARTNDGGNSWQLLEETVFNDNVSYYYTAVVFTSATEGWLVTSGFACGNFGKIFHSTDGGDSWTEVFSDTGFDLKSVHFSIAGNGWAVGSHGTILHYCAPAQTELEQEICEGESYEVGSSTYSASGVYMDTLAGVAGCDSIVMLDLTVHPSAETAIDTAVCDGESVTIGTQAYDQAGTHQEVLLTTNGCDSTVTLDLSINPTYDTTIPVTLCPGDTPPSDQFLMTAAGCDSIIRYQITEVTAQAEAGQDYTICEPDAVLNAQSPTAPITGVWAPQGNDAIVNVPTAAQTAVFELSPGANVFTWTLSHPDCPNFSQDAVSVFYEDGEIVAEGDLFYASLGATLMENVVMNDDVPDADAVRVSILEEENGTTGELTIGADGELMFSLPEPSTTFYRAFTYRVEHESCPELNDEARSVIRFTDDAGGEAEEEVSLVFTPNGDGVNDVFIIPELEDSPEDFPRNSLSVINRWGDVVYYSSPYNNDWDGTHYRTGKPLPPGTYFYVARLSVVEGIIRRERVTLIR